jgi:shikimate kinase
MDGILALDNHDPHSIETRDLRWRNGNIVLTGSSGSGKTSVGQHLAQLAGLGFVDVDNLIERRSGKSIAAIFEGDGESVFREIEARVLSELQAARGQVIAVGGGALLSDDAIELAHRIGPIVWVQSSPVEVARRLYKRVSEMEKRPIFRDLMSEENHEKRRDMIQARVQKMMDDRGAWYTKADIVLDGSYVTPEMAAHHLKDILMTEGLIGRDKNRFASWRKDGEK